MKRLSLLFVLLFVLSLSTSIGQNEVNLNTFDTNIAKKIASAILDSNGMIGVFEIPATSTRLKSLKSGIVPEVQPGYLDIITKYDLIKMNLLTSIKGDFDSVVFIRRPNVELTQDQNPLFMHFFPFSGTKWLLIVRKVYGALNNEADSWVQSLKTKNASSYLRSNTLYQLNEDTFSSLCIEWPNTFQKPAEMKVAGYQLIEDLELIKKNIRTLQSGPSKEPESLLPINLSSIYGKEVANAIRLLRNK